MRNARDWIVLQALGKRFLTGCRKEDVDVLLKWLASSGGPVVLEACLPHLLPDEAGVLFEQEQVDKELGRRVRLLVEVLCIPKGNEHAALLAVVQDVLTLMAEQEDVDLRAKEQWEGLARTLEEFSEPQARRESEEDSCGQEADQAHPGWNGESGEEDLREEA